MTHAIYHYIKVRNWYWCYRCQKYYQRPYRKAWVYSLAYTGERHRLTLIGTDEQRNAHEAKHKKVVVK